jgi:hypothetical protein
MVNLETFAPSTAVQTARRYRLGISTVLALWLVWAAGMMMNATAALAACPSIPGADQIWSNASLRWIWVGETHGSNETPAVVGELVCDALSRGRSVTVALERPSSEQAALEGILTAPDLSAAKKVLLSEPGWRDGMDGRASEAMLDLLVTLRELRKQYPALHVFAMEGPFADAIGARDEAMGEAVLSLKTTRPDDLILVLSGNVHAMLNPIFGYKTSAMYLPPQELLSLEVTDRGGQTWKYTSDGCGAQSDGVADKSRTRPMGIYLDPSLAPVGKVDGILALGVPLTASPPAAGEVSPVPDCRKTFLSRHPADTRAD